MATVIKLYETGAADVLKVEQQSDETLGKEQVWLEQEAVGVNFLDVTQRNGAVPVPLPNGLGLEAAGRVTAVGPGVTNVAVGDRVAYALGPLGAYASARAYPADRLIKIPDSLTADDAASVLFKGLTAQYLLKSTYAVGAGTVVLVYGAAGPVGKLLVSWASHLGADVIGVVSRESSVERATRAGCRAVLVWGQHDVPAEVSRLTDGKLAHVVYDGVGRATFDASIASLRARGMMVSIGASSGAPEPVSLATLNQKSLFLARPGLGAHIGDAAEYRERAADVLAAVHAGVLQAGAWRALPLAEAAEAHRLLESGQSEGTIILKP